MYPVNDVEFEEVTVNAVSGDSEHGWVIERSDGWSFGVGPESQIEPEVGMLARFYGRGIGATVRGLFLDGVKVFYRSPEEQKAIDDEWSRNYKLEEERRKLDPKNPDPQIEGFEWTDDMREISGFGSSYEQACRTMVSQGCKWWSEHPEADPTVKTYNRVYGIAIAENPDAKTLEEAMMAGLPESPTGAMHQAALAHIIHRWKKKCGGSWEKYQSVMREKETVQD